MDPAKEFLGREITDTEPAAEGEDFGAFSQVDRTPYGAFGWLGLFAVLMLTGGGYGIAKLSANFKDAEWLRKTNVSGAADSLLDSANRAAEAALDPAAAAADSAAKKATDAAKARATQELLQEKDAAIDEVKEAAANSLQGAAANAAQEQQEDFQKYIGR